MNYKVEDKAITWIFWGYINFCLYAQAHLAISIND